MKKSVLSLILLVCLLGTQAQQPTPEQKRLLFNKIDTLLSNYIRYSRFLEDGKSKITPGAISRFKSLFVSDDVMVPDETSPAYFNKDKKQSQFPSYNPMDKEAALLKGKVPVFNQQDASSISRLKNYSGKVDGFMNDFDNQRAAFYGAYNTLNRNVADYRTALKSQEAIVNRSVAEMVVMTEANYPDGLVVRMLNSAVNFSNLAGNEIKLLLEKRTEGKITGSSLKIETRDTLLLTVRISQNYSQLKIAKIDMIGYQLNFPNDKDRDFVADANDACPDENGMFQANGCPSADEKNFSARMNGYLSARKADSAAAIAARADVASRMKVIQDRIDFLTKKVTEPAHWWIGLGVSMGKFSGTLTNGAFGYLNQITQNEVNGATTLSGGKFFAADLALEHYFGAKAVFGIGTGIAYSSIKADLSKAAFHVEYQATDKGSASRQPAVYRQHITATGPVNEKISATQLTVPFLLIYKTNISEKLGIKIEGGIAMNLSFKTSTSGSPNASFDYEAVYNYDNGAATYDNSATPRASSWLITKNFASQHPGSAPAYFAEMKGRNYPVGLGVSSASVNGDASFSSGVGFIVRPSLFYNFNKGSYLSLGVVYASSSGTQSGNYRLIDENQRYNSLMQGVSKITSNSMGLRLTFTHSLFYNVPKWTRELSGLR